MLKKKILNLNKLSWIILFCEKRLILEHFFRHFIFCLWTTTEFFDAIKKKKLFLKINKNFFYCKQNQCKYFVYLDYNMKNLLLSLQKPLFYITKQNKKNWKNFKLVKRLILKQFFRYFKNFFTANKIYFQCKYFLYKNIYFVLKKV